MNKAAAATPSCDPPVQRWYIMLAIGVSAVLAAGVALVLLLATVHATPTSTVTSDAARHLGGVTPTRA